MPKFNRKTKVEKKRKRKSLRIRSTLFFKGKNRLEFDNY